MPLGLLKFLACVLTPPKRLSIPHVLAQVRTRGQLLEFPARSERTINKRQDNVYLFPGMTGVRKIDASIFRLLRIYWLYIQHSGQAMKRCDLTNIKLPLLAAPIHAGFPSPAADYLHETLSLTNLLVTHPSATFLAWAEGDSMELAGIFDGDLLVVDRSLTPRQNDIVIASVDSQKEFSCKVFDMTNKQLVPASNNEYPSINCEEGVNIEGVVAHSVRMHRPANYIRS
jgi:DNA polymerase V